jgi:hypothetical protein
MTEGFAKARWLSSWALPTYGLHLKLTLSGPVGRPSGATQTCPGVSGSLSELLEPGISTSEDDMIRGIKRGARWEEVVNRWPFRKGVDDGRAPGLHLHCKPGGPTRARPSPELANEDHWLKVANSTSRSSQVLAMESHGRKASLGDLYTWPLPAELAGDPRLVDNLGARPLTIDLLGWAQLSPPYPEY